MRIRRGLLFPAVSDRTPGIPLVRLRGCPHGVGNRVSAGDNGRLTRIHVVSILPCRHFSPAGANGDPCFSVGLDVDAVAPRGGQCNCGIRGVDFECRPVINVAQTDIQRTFRHPHLDSLVVQVQEGELGVRTQPDRRGAHVDFSARPVGSPEMITGGQGIVQVRGRPFIDASRGERILRR